MTAIIECVDDVYVIVDKITHILLRPENQQYGLAFYVGNNEVGIKLFSTKNKAKDFITRNFWFAMAGDTQRQQIESATAGLVP